MKIHAGVPTFSGFKTKSCLNPKLLWELQQNQTIGIKI
ncbi:hypothetical protein LEP1GSC086_3276 [Leptospira weilii str. LNT 1234]|nr:hypothetical protein LEP1GSC086_3276 [Leptospira weilii str. LNT 1234]